MTKAFFFLITLDNVNNDDNKGYEIITEMKMIMMVIAMIIITSLYQL